MKLQSILLPYGLFLGPMAGYSDHAMRQMCRKMGAEMTVTEMVSAKAICFGDSKTSLLSRVFFDETPTALQLFGHECDILSEATRKVEGGEAGYARPSAIDINMGCPMKKIISGGDGGALMKSPLQIEALVKAVALSTSLPVTVKIRAGWDEDHINATECAKAAESGGAQMVCVHGRTVKQVYSGKANWAVIGAVKGAVSIPVVGNGDILSGEDALRMKQETGCDGIMVARGAIGNPFLFREIHAALAGEPYTPPTITERVETALSQLRQACLETSEHHAIPASRGQIAAYVFGLRGAADVRRRVNCAKTYAEVEDILLGFARQSSEEN
ncbi:MAG: tRNA dihydrouridine synthase DusB [Clostridia bacterium]|nr:tRNA dihydrouridine synthase DusB [Clostridia bacterium]